MNNPEPNNNLGYEASDAKFKPIFIAGLSLLAIMIVGMLISYFLFGVFQKSSEKRSKPVSPLAQERQLPEGPRLQVDPDYDWVVFEAKQDSILNSYGWISKEAGVVRVPIEKAIEISLERGFPVRPAREEK